MFRRQECRSSRPSIHPSVRLLLRHQLPAVTGVFCFSSQEKVPGAISSGMQKNSVACRAQHRAAFLSEHTGKTPSASMPLTQMLSWGVSCIWVYALKKFSHIITRKTVFPTFFFKEKLVYQQLQSTVHLLGATLINTQDTIS